MKTVIRTLAALLVCAGVVRAQYAIDWFSIDSGGGTSTGGAYTLTGTIGQLDAGSVLSGGTYSLEGGFWPGLVVPSAGEAPTLFLQFSGANIVISWSPATPGYTLEQTDNLSTPVWSPSPSGNPTAPLAPTGTTRFYRLTTQP